MEMTDIEIEEAERWAKALEKSARQWRWYRWLLLGVAVFVLAGATYGFQQSEMVANENSSLQLSGDGQVPEKYVGEYIDARLGLFRIEMRMGTNVYFMGALGGILLGLSIGTWNKHRRHHLKAKFIRMQLSSRSH